MNDPQAALELAVERILHDRTLTRAQQDEALHQAVVEIMGTSE